MIKSSKENPAPRLGAPTGGFTLPRLFFSICLFLAMLALISYSPQDAAALSGGTSAPPSNWIGVSGAAFSWYLLLWFGLGGYLIVTLLLLRSLRLFWENPGKTRNFLTGTLLFLSGALLLLAMAPEPFAGIIENLGLGRRDEPLLGLSGGVLGQFLAAPPTDKFSAGCLRALIGTVGTMVLGWILVTAGGVILYISDWHRLLCDRVLLPGAEAAAGAGSSFQRWAEERRAAQDEETEEESAAQEEQEEEAEETSAPPRRSLLKELFKQSREEEPEPEPEEPAAAQEAELPMETPVEEPPRPEEKEIVPAEPEVEPEAEQEKIEPAPPVRKPLSFAAAKNPAPADTVPVRGNAVAATMIEKGQAAPAVSAAQYTLPLITQLGKGGDAVGEDPAVIESSKLILQRTLDSFNIQGSVTGHISGPRITRYEISLVEGVNVKKINQIEDTLQMTLRAKSIRVLAPIPGRDVVGIEIPNSRSEAVFMRSVMETEAWNNPKLAIPIVLGKDVSNKPVVLDLAKAPHLLIAGSTGSGKSVCMNTLIMSLLFKFSPDDLKLIMVDPKIVEFEDYRKLPHLITPLINDAKKVPLALRWAVTEMENRYKILARAGVKKLAEFNKLPKEDGVLKGSDGNPLTDAAGKPITHMPILIVIIDELAELRMQESWKDSETYIARIAQLGRAAGVHIVVATQRPSTNIITGVIKANLPTRIAFRVMQLVDSRVILDVPGAENLLGLGDMLYMPPGGANIERVQGALVDDNDIKKIVEFVSQQRPQHFNESVTAEEEEEEEIDEDYETIDAEDRADIEPLVKKYLRPGDDDTMKRALEVVILDRKASTSYIQRRLKIGYNRAAELIDQMEERGILGPPSGSGNKREILIFDGMEIGE